MALSGDARAQAVYNALNLGGLNNTEKQQVLAGLKVLYGADTTYLTGSTVVSVNTTSTIGTGTIGTAGSATAQAGPPSPLPVSGTGSGTIS